MAVIAVALATNATARVRFPLPEQEALSRLAPAVNHAALAKALDAVKCAQSRGHGTKAERLTFIDYSLPSLEVRLWVFDLREPRLLFAEHVAHGKGTGENMSRRFSNEEGTLQTSLGLFLTAETYQGKNGYSLKLDGLEPGINDAARARTIVMHGAPYVDPVVGRKQGRLGRSWGCPAVRPAVAVDLLDAISGGNFVFAWYPDDQWLACSAFLHCDQAKPTRPPPRRRGALPRSDGNARTR